MGLFDKKYCSVCGEKIGLLGNRKLEDGNLCKKCAARLSPFFSDRRSSTVEQIKEQLAYREENKNAVKAFHTTRSFGEDTKILIDEDNRKFLVTRERDLMEANPDVLDFSVVTGVEIDVDEDVTEDYRQDKDGNSVSYNPPRYTYSYEFSIIIHVNHPYFDTIRFDLTDSSIYLNETPVIEANKPDPMKNQEYVAYDAMSREIKETLLGARQQARDEQAQQSAPPTVLKCPYCGATTTPDKSGCCEYCGSPLNN